MENGESVQGWPEVLSRLDRHGISGLLTPDVAGLRELMQTYRVPGVSIAAGCLDGDVWCAGYGVAGVGRPDRVSCHAVFQACSISKHAAAFGALLLVGDGVLDLDADIICSAAYGLALAWAGVQIAARQAEGRLPELCQIAVRSTI